MDLKQPLRIEELLREAEVAGSSPARPTTFWVYVFLLEDADVRRWYRNVACVSQVTADIYLLGLGHFATISV